PIMLVLSVLLLHTSFLFSFLRPPPTSTLFPYTTLFRSTSASVPEGCVKTQDPEWYAQQAAKLRDELQRRQAQLNGFRQAIEDVRDRKSTRLNSSHGSISYAVFCLKKKKKKITIQHSKAT